MTRTEYQELTEFLGKKFDTVDRRFSAIDRRFDGIEGRLARVEVGLEENRHQTQILAEGMAGVRTEMRRGFDSVWDELRSLSGRMDRWEARAS